MNAAPGVVNGTAPLFTGWTYASFADDPTSLLLNHITSVALAGAVSTARFGARSASCAALLNLHHGADQLLVLHCADAPVFNVSSTTNTNEPGAYSSNTTALVFNPVQATVVVNGTLATPLQLQFIVTNIVRCCAETVSR